MQTVIVTKPLNSDRRPAALAFESCAGASADGCSGPEISAWSLGAPYVLGGVARPVRRPPQNAGRRRASQRPADGSPGGPVACARRPEGNILVGARGGRLAQTQPTLHVADGLVAMAWVACYVPCKIMRDLTRAGWCQVFAAEPRDEVPGPP